MKMPNWTIEELILALQLYCKHDLNWLNRASEQNIEIIELSDILRNLPIHGKEYKDTSNFRSPSSIHMKLMNFLRYDNQHGNKGLRVGLQNGSKLEQKVWDEFAKNVSKIDEKAALIFKKYSAKDDNNIITKETFFDSDLNIEEILLPIIDEIIIKIEDIKNDYINKRKEAAFMESLDESQNIINDMYKNIMQLNRWNEGINVIKKEIKESSLSQQNQQVESKVEEFKDVKIGKMVKINLTDLILSEELSCHDIESMVDESWSRETLHIGYPFLKVYEQSLPKSEQQKVDGNYRYWAQVFSYKGENYLACKEWYESNRKYFLAWMSKLESKTTNKINNKDAVKDTINIIKFSDKYSSIALDRELLIFILKSIKEIDEDEVCIETKAILEKIADKVQKESTYKNPQNLLDNIIKFLTDKNILVPFKDSKRDKYVIEDYEIMHDLIAEPKIIKEL